MKYLVYDLNTHVKSNAVGDINLTIVTRWLSLRIDDWRKLAVSIAPAVPSPHSKW
jgi:hypothetical protein